jgi:hypothetical protein
VDRTAGSAGRRSSLSVADSRQAVSTDGVAGCQVRVVVSADTAVVGLHGRVDPAASPARRSVVEAATQA